MSNQEYEHIENKQGLGEKHEATVAIAAFATAQGGTVRFGITPDGRSVSVQLGRTTLEELANYVRQNTDPPQFPSITVDGDENSAIVSMQIEESPVKPVWAFGKPYKRVGRTNQSLSRDESQRLHEQTTGRTWDALPCPGLTEAALDRRAVEDYLKRAGQDKTTETTTVLDNLHLRLSDGSLCNAAVLLFAAAPWRFLDGVQVKCGRFRGTDSVDFLDERTLEGDVLGEINEALAFVTRNTRQAIRFTGRPEREIVPEYPEEAVREAVVNAICHRDYTSPGTVQIRIYDDGLEVWNPATLPFDLTIEQLYDKHSSRPRNRKLADALYRARLIEQWGTGTLRMVRVCEEQGLPKPEYRYEMGTFIVRFRPAPTQAQLPDTNGLNKRQIQAIVYMREHGAISRSQYENLTGVKKRQAAEDLAMLLDTGVVRREGSGPSTQYVLVAKS